MTIFAWAWMKLPCLLADGFHHFGVAVAGIGHADAAGEIEQFPPIAGVDVGPFGALGNKVEDARPDRGHVRKVFGVELLGVHGFPLSFPRINRATDFLQISVTLHLFLKLSVRFSCRQIFCSPLDIMLLQRFRQSGRHRH